jgi:HK97 family phage prohead protease
MIKNNVFNYKFDMKLDGVTTKGFIKGIATTPKLDSYDDIIAGGAFEHSIRDRGVTGPRGIKMLAQHDSRHVIGNWTELKYNGDPLHAEGQLDLDNQKGLEYYNHIKKDQIGSLSVGFRTQERTYNEDTYVRTITKGDLREISPVTFPANEECVITQVKSDYGSDVKLSDIEKEIAQQFGLSRKQSCGLIRVVRSSGLLASAAVVPETAAAPIEVKDESNLLILKMIEDMKHEMLLEHIRRVTESIRG